MNILFIAPANSIHTVKWVNAFCERGHDVILVSLPNHAEIENRISNKVNTIYLPISGTKGYYLNAPILRKIFYKLKPDVCNAHYASGYGTLARIAKIPRLILSVWGSDVYEFPYQSKLKEIIIKKNLKSAYKIASTSHCMANKTNELLDGNRDIAVTPFGVNTGLFKPAEDNKHDSKIVFGIIKLLTPKYGVNDLIAAYEIFAKGNEGAAKNTELHIYGDGEERHKLEKQAKETNLPGIKFYGRIPNSYVPAVLNEMDVFCCSSSSESFGVAAVEAMSCGLPVIATDVDGFREVVVDKETGLIVPRKDPEAMADKMKILYKDNYLRKKMGENGRNRVLEKYDWENNVTTMIDLYIRTMGER